MQQNPNLFVGLGPFAGLTQAGSQLATKGIQSLFNIKDPELERTRILKQTNTEDPASLRAAAQALMAQGDIGLGMQLASQARSITSEERKYQLDIAKYRKDLLKETTEEGRKQAEFYAKNPEQATFRLQELAKTLAANPKDPVALSEYERITAAASSGAMEQFEKEQKAKREEAAASVGLDKDRALVAKYRKELEDASKLGSAERWDAEREAAINLLKINNIDPNKPLSQSEQLLNPELVRAQKLAQRNPLGTKKQITPAFTSEPSALEDIETKVKAAGQTYDPEKYDYRIGPNGEIQRKKK